MLFMCKIFILIKLLSLIRVGILYINNIDFELLDVNFNEDLVYDFVSIKVSGKKKIILYRKLDEDY